MERSIIILFKGVCTHLVATHEYLHGPAFELRARGESIQHRVFLANPGRINEIHEDCRPGEHVPLLRIHESQVTEQLKWKMVMGKGHAYELGLRNVGIAFEPLDQSKGTPKHGLALKPPPKTYFKSKALQAQLDENLRLGWSDKTGACIDFTGGVKFTAGPHDLVVAQVWFTDNPHIVFRDKNTGNGERYPLEPDTLIEISNEPVVEGGHWDYVLHYLATTLDLSKIDQIPNWYEAADESPAGEVYCSNSTYP